MIELYGKERCEAFAEYAIKKMFKRKLVIIPGLLMKLNYIFNRFVPIKLLLKIAYNIQRSKKN